MLHAGLDLSPAEIRKLLGRQSPRAELEEAIARVKSKEYKAIRDAIPDSPLLSSVRHFAHLITSHIDQAGERRIYDVLFGALQTMATTTSIQFFREHLFESVLSQNNSSLWICSDDQTAWDAVAFLKARGRRVPEEVAVMGFDDWRESLGHGLTTYNFNMTGMVQRAIHLIRDEREFKNAKVVSEVDGYVVERRTTGKIKNSSPFR
jgi:DNA-binding LacI/PurR family transcriptional regulator